MTVDLDLTFAPATLFLFGLCGSGKSFIGDLIGRHAGWSVYHADDDITAEMRLALKEKRPFSDKMRDRYFSIVAKKILLLQQSHEHLVITQATYKQRHRDYLTEKIPGMEMIYISAPQHIISQRLKSRNNGIEPVHAEILAHDFEPPADTTKKIINDGDSMKIIEQLNLFYGANRIQIPKK